MRCVLFVLMQHSNGNGNGDDCNRANVVDNRGGRGDDGDDGGYTGG